MRKNRSWVLDARLCWVVLAAFSALTFFPMQSEAALVQSKLADGSVVTERTQQIETIRQALEKEVVVQRLADFGMTPQEVNAKLPSLSDEQLHQLAGMSKDIAGGDGVGLIIGVLLVILLVIVILKLLNKEVIVR